MTKRDTQTAFWILLALTIWLCGCGAWLNDTRTGLLAANAGLNSYDDIAVELWADAQTNPQAKEQLGTSLCASLLTQDALIQAWDVTTAVDAGLAKKTEITPYIAAAITVLDSLEDYLEMGGVPIPETIKAALSYLERMNPGGALAPDAEPLEQCADLLAERYPSAGIGAVPWATIITTGADLALYLLDLVQSNLAGEDVPITALETYIRDVLKQSVLYEQSLGAVE